MPIEVEVPNVGVIEFPDGTSEQTMRDALNRLPQPGFSMREMIGPAVLGGAALAGGLALRNPALIGQAARTANNIRKAAMLAGWAPAKSGLGNIGAGVVSSLERGSTAPIREIISPQWVKDVIGNFAKGGRGAYGTHVAQGLERFYNVPGRVMGAMDEATGAALQRAGLTAAEAQRELLQGPAANSAVEAIAKGGPVADYLLPFVRIPLNMLLEGAQTLNPQTARQAATLAIMGGAGVAEGYNTEGYLPLSLGAALGGRYAVPTMIGQALGRTLKGGNVKEAAFGFSPFSDFNLESFWEPLDPFKRMAKRFGIR